MIFLPVIHTTAPSVDALLELDKFALATAREVLDDVAGQVTWEKPHDTKVCDLKLPDCKKLAVKSGTFLFKAVLRLSTVVGDTCEIICGTVQVSPVLERKMRSQQELRGQDS